MFSSLLFNDVCDSTVVKEHCNVFNLCFGFSRPCGNQTLSSSHKKVGWIHIVHQKYDSVQAPRMKGE